jgi:6-phosphogluconolactonase
MTKRETRIFPTLEAASWAVATRFEDLARIQAIDRRPFTAALSGGSSPKLLYQILGSPTFAGRVHWANVHLFQVDERCVPPEDERSNYRMMRETLLTGNSLPEDNFHRMQAERMDRERASQDYADEIARILKPGQGQWPRFDFLLLGMGTDGHTASLFPGTAALKEEVAWVCPNYIEKLKMYRLTLTFPVLNSASHVIFLVSGEDKAEVLQQVLEGPPGHFPAQRIQPSDGRVSWFLEEAAAHLLSNQAKG